MLKVKPNSILSFHLPKHPFFFFFEQKNGYASFFPVITISRTFPFLLCLLGTSEAILEIVNSKFRFLKKLLITNEIIQNLALRMFISALVITENNW